MRTILGKRKRRNITKWVGLQQDSKYYKNFLSFKTIFKKFK